MIQSLNYQPNDNMHIELYNKIQVLNGLKLH